MINKDKLTLMTKAKEHSFDSIIKSPYKILPITFFFLCLFGGIMLTLPISGTHGSVAFLDALFTAVSAVCVTGLTVVSTGGDYTNFGQFMVLFLIQSGGLGIMSISSIIFILLGKRMSLSHEKTARSIFEAGSKEEIRDSLVLIFKYTFLIEFIGAIILSVCFALTENSILSGIKLGVFTSVSAFCNAGFFLKDSNLLNYYANPIITYTVSFLIIFGGISPAICVMLANLFKGKKLAPVAVIVFNTTLALLFGGALFFFISEYNGVLQGMSFIEKINNSWFQSATARTAGFNTVDLSHINAGTFLLMVSLMIAGGSPGGTAGGIKTGTIGILALCCYNAIRGRDNIIRNRNITPETIQKAITLTILYLLVLLISILMLITTQTVKPAHLVFEAASALGTVGLSMGATPYLDEIGKVIIILTMFMGRVGPATLVCYINAKHNNSRISYPDTKISLT